MSSTALQNKKLTVQLKPALHSELVERAGKQGLKLADYIRRAVALKMFLDDNEGTLILEREDGEKVQLVQL